MVKAEWGSKRTCPKCATRFYDLGKEDPVTCIECGTEFHSRARLEVEAGRFPSRAIRRARKKKRPIATLGPRTGNRRGRRASADDEVDLSTGDDDLGVTKSDDNDDNN